MTQAIKSLFKKQSEFGDVGLEQILLEVREHSGL